MTDLPDWQKGVSLFSGDVAAMMAADFPDWTDGVNVVTTPPSPPGDYPDWTKNVSQVSGLYPTPPIPSPLAWWDASALSGIADGSKLASWLDETGRAHNLVQANPAAQPTYYSSTAGKTVNGRPAVWFDGAATFMAVALAVPQPFTVCLALQASTEKQMLFCNGNATDPYVWNQPTSVIAMSAGAAPQTFGGLTTGSVQSVIACFDGAASYVQTNATVNTAASTIGTDGLSTAMVGAYQSNVDFLNGPICEVLVYGRHLSSADATTVYNHFKTRWATP